MTHSDEPRRELLRVNQLQAVQLWPELQDDINFNEFLHRLKSIAASERGKTRVLKRLFLEMQDPKTSAPWLRGAVHKMGPVPLFMLPESYLKTSAGLPLTLSIRGSDINPQIGIYPKLDLTSTRSDSISSKALLLRSFVPCFHTLLQKYLEDIGEHFADITNYLSKPVVYARAKQVEEILSQSINAKITLVIDCLDHSECDSFGERDPLNKLAQNVWNAHSDWIILGALAQIFVAVLLQDLNRHLGVEHWSETYSAGWARISPKLADFYGVAEYNDHLENAPDLKNLCQKSKYQSSVWHLRYQISAQESLRVAK